MFFRLFSPTLTHRVFDPMPLPRRMPKTSSADNSASDMQITSMKFGSSHSNNGKKLKTKNGSSKKFSYRVKKIPRNK